MTIPFDMKHEFLNALGLLRSHLNVEEEMDLTTYNVRRGMLRAETGDYLRRVWHGISRGCSVEPENVDGKVGEQAETGQ